MNGRTAKRLRREAQRQTPGLPERRLVLVTYRRRKGSKRARHGTFTMLRNDPLSARGRYHELKKR